MNPSWPSSALSVCGTVLGLSAQRRNGVPMHSCEHGLTFAPAPFENTTSQTEPERERVSVIKQICEMSPLN